LIVNNEKPPSWLDLESILRLSEASRRTSLSPDTLRRRYRQYVVALSDRRDGMKLKHVLAIADGTADRA
jgi:hypothetical protein